MDKGDPAKREQRPIPLNTGDLSELSRKELCLAMHELELCLQMQEAYKQHYVVLCSSTVTIN
jgi:hypothetical protein